MALFRTLLHATNDPLPTLMVFLRTLSAARHALRHLEKKHLEKKRKDNANNVTPVCVN